MATRLLDVLTQEGTHAVGNLNSKWAKHYANGAILTGGNVDNFTIVELDGYDEEGNAKCKKLSDKGHRGYLVTTVEEEQLQDFAGFHEGYRDFYNKEGEIVRLTILDDDVRFETSNFTNDTSNTDGVKKGNVAHFDVTTGKYIISKASAPHADYEASALKFEVVDEDTDLGYAYGIPTIRLKVLANIITKIVEKPQV